MPLGCSGSFGRRCPGVSGLIFHFLSFWESNLGSPGWDGEEEGELGVPSFGLLWHSRSD